MFVFFLDDNSISLLTEFLILDMYSFDKNLNKKLCYLNKLAHLNSYNKGVESLEIEPISPDSQKSTDDFFL